MSNKIENNDISFNSISIEEQDKIKSEMLRYRVNGLSYKLTLLGLLFSVCAAFICLNSIGYNWLTIIKILLNIVILLFGFLFAEKSKNYSNSANIGLFVLGGLCIGRIFWAPLMLLTGNNLGQVVTSTTGEINWLPANAQFRGIIAIVCLVCAAACFIFSGVHGYIQTKKLTTYLNSLKDDKDLGGKR